MDIKAERERERETYRLTIEDWTRDRNIIMAVRPWNDSKFDSNKRFLSILARARSSMGGEGRGLGGKTTKVALLLVIYLPVADFQVRYHAI